MRVATIERGGRQLWGVVDGQALTPAVGLSPTLRSFLDKGGAARDLEGLSAAPVPLGGARWLPPVPEPSKIWCVGLNFDDYRRMLGLDFLRAPNIFLKAPSALVGHGADVEVPKGYGTVYHEWELTAVVGRTLRDASVEEAEAAIFGYTILDDLTFHEIELINRDHQQWAKNVDGFAPCGPWIVTPDEFDPSVGRALRRYRNGELEASSSTDQMRHQPPELLSFISTFSTLLPGDLVTAGTPPAGPCHPPDTITGAVEGLGELTVHLTERSVDPQWQIVLDEPPKQRSS
ncbi:MAG TPA: fumarylacetoacetate hydrolase family protein [Egibacteraceae bacterium]|nr:fumarylacetoacetate hydrolase family protein [Egibacteraceae bacterium]